jgi:hypothetical protein
MVTTMLLMVEMVMVHIFCNTGLNGLHNGVPTAAALPVASTKANQPITQMQAKTCTMRSTMMVYLITLKVQ